MATKGMTVFFVTSRLDEMTAFYSGGLDIQAERSGPSWASFRLGESEFALHAGRDPVTTAGAEVSFLVDDLNAATERFRAQGARVDTEPHDEAFGRIAELRDPEGRKFTLVEPN